MQEEFQRYPLKTFRNGFYNLKRDTGFHLRENIAKINKGIARVTAKPEVLVPNLLPVCLQGYRGAYGTSNLVDCHA
jgi:hypothetical protein